MENFLYKPWRIKATQRGLFVKIGFYCSEKYSKQDYFIMIRENHIQLCIGPSNRN